MRHFLLASSLLYSLLPHPPVQAQRSDAGGSSFEEVAYSSGDVALAASLLIPSGPGPFPAIVIVHGSGTSDRSNPWTSAYAEALVERGIAILHPDKRGSGASGGEWREASFSDLADDALAAVDLARAHPAVDPARVGLIGLSQGGHVVPLAAVRSEAVSFVINISGSMVPMMEQIGDEIRKMGEQEGLMESELETLRHIHDRAVHYALSGEDWEAYGTALAQSKDTRLGQTKVVQGFPTEPDSPAWAFLRTIGNYDPLLHWQNVDVPALFLYGGRDENVDVYKSVDVIEESLTATGLNYTLLLFRNNGHALFRDDALDFIARWVQGGGED